MVRTHRTLAVLVGSLLALLLSTAVASAAVSVGHSGWTWGSPRPQGNDLHGLAFASGGPGYAVGDFGTLLKTGDGGATWSGLSTGTTADLDLVQTIGGKRRRGRRRLLGATLGRRRRHVPPPALLGQRAALQHGDPGASRSPRARRASSCSRTAPCCARPTAARASSAARRSPARRRPAFGDRPARPTSRSSRTPSASPRRARATTSRASSTARSTAAARGPSWPRRPAA